jgi:hypothetical protein
MTDPRSPFRSLPDPTEGIESYRQRLMRLQAEAAEWRRKQIEEQSSPLNSPSVRIKAWERLHQVDLPRNPSHVLVGIIAAKTGLSADEVRAEQTSRAAVAE